jgi:fructan beta-fructosidase
MRHALLTILALLSSSALAGGQQLYHETYRPQFHFTAKKNWLNDPNGLVFYKGEYHLFFQHNPAGINWGNMTWGHAVSPDLVHWKQLADAIKPDKLGTIFSGSAVVDWDNTAGFNREGKPALVCLYTSAGKPFTQSLAYSTDRGRTFTKYPHNPVLNNVRGDNRDPKVFWHRPSRRWIMALYLDGEHYALFGSSNLKEWTKLSDVPPPGGSECPDLFELPVDGKPKNTRWVFWAGNGHYLIGRFDGKTFTRESGHFPADLGPNFYAAQTYSDIPTSDGRRIQIAWMRGGQYPGMPFNQQMSFPCELTLRTLPEGVRLCRQPVREISKLYNKSKRWQDVKLVPGDDPLKGVTGELLDVQAELEPGKATEIVLRLRGETIRYDVRAKELHYRGRKADLSPQDGRIKLRVLVDRTSVEIFANDGARCLSFCVLLNPKERGLGLSAVGGAARLTALEVHELNSAWETRASGPR